MDGQMDQDEIRPLGSKSITGPLTAMNGAVVDHPEDALRGAIGLGGHDLGDEGIEGEHSPLVDHVAEEAGSLHVPCGVVDAG